MNAELLLKEFHRLSEAPDAAPRLRRFILDLAVRGKLIEEKPNDEPAQELLRRIKQEKRVRGSAHKDISTLSVSSEPPFLLPQGWCWTSLGEISLQIHYGYTASADLKNRDIRFLRITDIQNGSVDWSSVPGCNISDEQAAQFLLADGDILVARTGGTIGKTFLVKKPLLRAVFASYLIRIQPSSLLFDKYVKFFMGSGLYWSQLEHGSRGAGQPNVNGRALAAMRLPLPPLAEQHRIVARVDELMRMCDELESAQANREARRDKLVTASLHCISSTANDPDSLQYNARFYFNHLPRLATRPEYINQLRQTILNLAIAGRLMPQDERDEPANQILFRIARAKEQPPAPPPAASPDLPRGWTRTKFQDILLDLITGPFGSSLHQHDYEEGGIPVINPASMIDGKIIPIAKMAVGQSTLERLVTFKLQARDIVLARRGEMGRAALVSKREEGWLCGTGSLILRFTPDIWPPFIVTLLGSPRIREQLSSASVGATMQNLNQSILRAMGIGLPPFQEQQRIVERVEQLMALCTELERGLKKEDRSRSALLQAALQQALASAEVRSEIAAGA